ncbi:MAG: hypothetical protein IKC82_03115 [Lentisphaeria bacterium]|nr:hypothetical protein [Lentisphaeria bacterium]
MNFPEIIYDKKPQWLQLYRCAWETCLQKIDYDSPGKGNPPIMTCMPGVLTIWQWDSCFMAMYAKYSNGIIAPMNNLDLLYSFQRDDGYISMAYSLPDGKERYGERVNPPLFAWVEYDYYRFTGDASRIARVYPILKKYFFWLKNNRRRKHELYFFEDTGSSGMDNSPRSGYSAANLAGSDVCFVDLSCQQLLAANYLAELAKVIGFDDDAKMWQTEAEELRSLINRYHYKPATAFYHDCFEATMNALANKTIAGFWSLLSCAADLKQAQALVDHLNDPKEFNSGYPIPSLSLDDPNFDPDGGYWLGSAWAPTNYMVIKGLEKYQYFDLARELTARHLDIMTEVMLDPQYGGIWECYAPVAPARPARRAEGELVREEFCGWSAIGPISMFIENILGLDFDGINKKVVWRLDQTCRNGIKDLNFAGGVISLICNGSDKISISSTVDFSIEIIQGNGKHICCKISAGETEITLG